MQYVIFLNTTEYCIFNIVHLNSVVSDKHEKDQAL